MITATYSPEDNKIRLYADQRLDAETYAKVKAAGFSWAPKQELFVAPMWTPERAALARSLADTGEIDDEDTSLADRAAERADRFDTYAESREQDAATAQQKYHAIADGIPLGQPILVGHHSEKRHRRDIERMRSATDAAVSAWKTAEYWQRRAAASIAAAKYKERPDVRARRIKKIEADLRKVHRELKDREDMARMYAAIDMPEMWKITKEGREFPTREERARHIANRCHLIVRRDETGRTWTAYDVLRPVEERYQSCPEMSIDDVIACAQKYAERFRAHAAEWIEHYEGRLIYERAMLAADGGTVADKTGPEKGGAVKCWVSRNWLEIQKVNKVSVTVMDNWGNGGPDFPRTVPFDKLHAVMSKADWDARKAANKAADNEVTP